MNIAKNIFFDCALPWLQLSDGSEQVLFARVSVMVDFSKTLVQDAALPTDEHKSGTFTADTVGDRRPRAVLLNPPGTQRYFRDYFCSLISKSRYYYHPIDLIYLSGILDRAGYFLDCVDSIAEDLTPAAVTDRIVSFAPAVLIYLTSSPSYEEDAPFLTALKQRMPHTIFVGLGDIYREIRNDALTLHPFCDAVLTDFSTPDLLRWLQRTEDAVFENIIYRGKDGLVRSGPEKHGYGFYSMPVPRWDLWPLARYRFPFAERSRWATILTDFGCPFSCTFCPMSTTGYKLRDIDTVMDEIRLLRALNIHELFLRDQTFGVNRARTKELLRRFREECPELRWTCWFRVDLVTEEYLRLIKDAGCHTIMFGIETANEDILKKMRKNTKRVQIERALTLARSVGLKTVGTVIIGFPEESEESIRTTIDFVCGLPLDYASFNIATPRFGTRFRSIMKEKGLIDTLRIKLDSSQSMPAWVENKDIPSLPNATIFSLQRTAIRRFYLRPLYLLRRLFTVRTFFQFSNQLQEGFELLFPKR